jgi:hypothetical protein
MFFKKKKTELSSKLEHIGFDKKTINQLIKCNYNFAGILTGSYAIFETIVNEGYEKIKNEEKSYEKLKNSYKLLQQADSN